MPMSVENFSLLFFTVVFLAFNGIHYTFENNNACEFLFIEKSLSYLRRGGYVLPALVCLSVCLSASLSLSLSLSVSNSCKSY